MRMLTMVLVAVAVAGCGGATIQKTDQPAPPAVSTPAPTDELPAPALLGGTGVITFGTAYDPDTLTVTKPVTRFKATYKGEIAWSASLAEPAGSTTLEIALTRRSKGGAEETIFQEQVPIANPEFDTLANQIDLLLLVDRKAGTYVMRYIREGTVLAEGEFTVVK